MKTFIFALFFTIPLFSFDIDLNARSAILMDAKTGQILFEKNARESLYPASISKIITALCVLENSVMDEEVEASREAVCAISTEEKKRSGYSLPSHWLEHGSSHIGIKVGERLSVETLLYGLMLQSGNDAANVLAEHVAGSVPQFVEMANRRIKDLGAHQTTLTNPHGLHHPDHLSTAYDMALVTRSALAFPAFRQIVSARSFERQKTNMQPPVQLAQKNRLTKPGPHYYPKAIGVKVGFTKHAKGTLVAAAEHEGRTLIGVVFGCYPFRETYRDVTKLFDAAFAEPPVKQVVMTKATSFSRKVPLASRRLVAELREDLVIATYDPISYCTQVIWDRDALPIAKGERCGVVQTVARDIVLGEQPLYAKRSIKHSYFAMITSWPIYLKLGVAVAGLFLLFQLFIKGHKLFK